MAAEPIEICAVGSGPWNFYAIEMRTVVVGIRYYASAVEDYMKESQEQRLLVAIASTTVVVTKNSAS